MFTGKAWRAPSTTGTALSALRLTDAVWEPPAPGRLLVRVAACGVGYPDVLITAGTFPGVSRRPAEPGQEVAGEVVAVPEGSAFAVGDRVLGFTPFLDGLGGLGEYAYAWEPFTRLAPAAMTDEEAAGFLIAHKTAHHALVDRTTVTPGEVVVVLGAAGSSGSAAVQLAKVLGATVIAAASSEQRLAFARALRADHTVDYATEDLAMAVRRLTGQRGADVVFDPVGGEIGTAAGHALATGGRFELIGFAAGSFATVTPMDLLTRNASLVGVLGGAFASADVETAAVDRVVALAADATIRTPIGAVLGFADAPEAIHRIATRQAVGKSVVRVAG